MARSSHDTRIRILTSAYRQFYKAGFARVSMDHIAEAASVTKRTVYNHFGSKDSLAAAVLEHQHEYVLGQIQSWADLTAASPGDFLVSLFARFESWAAEPGWVGSGFTRITMELADRPGHPARHAARRHKFTIERWLASELESRGTRDPGDLAREVMLLMEGCLCLVLIHGDTRYARAASSAARRLARPELE